MFCVRHCLRLAICIFVSECVVMVHLTCSMEVPSNKSFTLISVYIIVSFTLISVYIIVSFTLISVYIIVSFTLISVYIIVS